MKAYKPKDAVYTRIESGDDWSKVYQHVCGVPDDGTEVQAEAFVLGNPDLILEISHADGLFKVRVPNSDGFSMSQIEPDEIQLPSWVLPQSGELVRYALVALPVAAGTPSQRVIRAVSKMAEQLVQGDLDDSECGAGVPVAADIPKGADAQASTGKSDSDLLREEAADREQQRAVSEKRYHIEEFTYSKPQTFNAFDGENVIGKFWSREHAEIFLEAMEADVSEKPKVWLMRHRVGGHRVSSGQLQPEYNADRDTWDVDESGWVKHVPDEIVPLIHPAHNLKPGECCEVPARECLHETLTFTAATGAEPVNPLHANVKVRAQCDRCGETWAGNVRVGTAKAIQHHYNLTEAPPTPEVPAREDDTGETHRREVAQKTIDRLKRFSDALESGKPLEESGYRVTEMESDSVPLSLAMLKANKLDAPVSVFKYAHNGIETISEVVASSGGCLRMMLRQRRGTKDFAFVIPTPLHTLGDLRKLYVGLKVIIPWPSTIAEISAIEPLILSCREPDAPPVPDTRSPSVSIGNTRYWLGHNDGQVTLWERRGTEDAVCWHACNIPTSPDAARAFNALRSVPSVATETPGTPVDEEGARWEKPRDLKDAVFLGRYENEELWFGRIENALDPRWNGPAMGFSTDTATGWDPLDYCEKETEGRWAEAVKRARQLGLVGDEGGARWHAKEEWGTFIGRFGEWDGYASETRIWRVMSSGEWMALPGTPGCIPNDARNWVEECPYSEDAKMFRAIYDAALTANKLPPHPRYPRPEGATDWLGWFSGGVVNRFDGWWRGGDISLVSGEGCSAMEADRISGYPGPWFQALARARELGLPERDARKARLADLERRRAEIDGKIAELREVSNA